ncbi:ABC transporter substrate-binding protein [Fundicoccus culcitae]|uniref:Sugar ABC transporter substrate-binding protein n=1 Tax=Fundicoccus culcitae TaxID=2969821 RepID=A0ABY5P539_9LACT|nr:sugar ABC transporter substrate-binding protein [Fundicoccus culcitae]UUX33523.1 sugar ABC transporter substrate-binding protein [Fundicoccus culcitae]
MKNFKKIIMLLLTVVFFSGNLSLVSAQEDNVISLWVQYSEESAEGQVMVNSANEFNETNEFGYIVEVNYVPRSASGGGYEDVINAALTTNTLPDVFTLDGPNVAAYASSGMLQPLDDYITNQEDILPSIIDQGTFDGNLYAAGYSESGVGIYYNIDMLEEAGIDITTLPTVDDPWDWNQFNELLEQLYAHYNKPILNMGFDDHSEWLLYAFAPYVWSAGGDIVSEDTTKAIGVFDSDANVTAFEFIQSLIENNYSTITPIEYGFHSGEYALYMSGSWTMQQLDSEYPDTNYGIMPYPVSPETQELVSPTGSWAYGMSTTTDNPDAAGALIDFLMSEEQLYNMSMGNSVLPARQSVADRMMEEVSEPMAILIEQNTKTGKARPKIVDYPQISRTFQQTVTESTYFEQNSDVKALLEIKAQEMESILVQ